MKEGTCCDDNRVRYGVLESLYGIPEINVTLDDNNTGIKFSENLLWQYCRLILPGWVHNEDREGIQLNILGMILSV